MTEGKIHVSISQHDTYLAALTSLPLGLCMCPCVSVCVCVCAERVSAGSPFCSQCVSPVLEEDL